MKKKMFTEEQINAALKESEARAATKDLCRKHEISEPTFYNWKAKNAGMTVSEARRLRESEAEKSLGHPQTPPAPSASDSVRPKLSMDVSKATEIKFRIYAGHYMKVR
jgi:putative transposase